MAVESWQWGEIESTYMNSDNLHGISIKKTVVNQPNFPTPYVVYEINDSSGKIIGRAMGPGH